MYYPTTGTNIITYDDNISLTYPVNDIIYNNYGSNKTFVKKIKRVLDCTTASSYKTYCASCATTSTWASDDTSYYHNYLTKNYVVWKESFCGYNTWPATPAPPAPPVPLSTRLHQIIQSRQAPLFIPSRTPIKAAAEEREMRARQTLRRMLGDDDFQRFLRNGFVSVRANSGKVYQIYPGHGMTVVYDRGTPIEKLCVVLHGDFTPTDSLIARYVMILHDEADFRALANVWTAPAKKVPNFRKLDTRSLAQIFQSLKAAA